MRIVILTHCADRHYYFCNQLIEKTGNVVGVITHAKDVNRSRYEKIVTAIKKKQVKWVLKNMLLNRIFKKYGRMLQKEKQMAEDKFFSGSAAYFNKNFKDLLLAQVSKDHRSINHDYYVSLINEKKPDIIVVMGTGLIGKKIILSAKYILNIHTGLSPYYRGGRTNLWPFIEEDFGYFGVTVHLMSLGIDSGDIIFTERPEICNEDNYGTINCKSIVIGTDLMNRTIQLLKNGQFRSIKQWTKGKLFNNRDMNNFIAYKYFKKKDIFISKHIELEKQNKLPKVNLVRKGMINDLCDIVVK
jgi:methionyl-tRNA formyltransferase